MASALTIPGLQLADEHAGLPVTEWIESADLCAQLAREIETAPVSMGLVKRPEQWPFSSAAID